MSMRADLYLTAHGYTQSRQRAHVLIEQGCVRIDGKLVKKPSQPIEDGAHEVTVVQDMPYVGRGGLKLKAAIDHFGIDVSGFVALDIGASTGGFTDCLLQHGTAFVYAVDSGSDQLAKKLLEDPRVASLEHINARGLTVDQVGGKPVDLIVMDVSFISATYILPRFTELLKPDGYAICLIKPQFEVGRAMLGKGGVVKDLSAHRFAIERVLNAAASFGLTPCGLMPSPIAGGDGNREFLVCFINSRDRVPKVNETVIDAVLKENG